MTGWRQRCRKQLLDRLQVLEDHLDNRQTTDWTEVDNAAWRETQFILDEIYISAIAEKED